MVNFIALTLYYHSGNNRKHQQNFKLRPATVSKQVTIYLLCTMVGTHTVSLMHSKINHII